MSVSFAGLVADHQWLAVAYVLLLSIGGLLLAAHWADMESAWVAFAVSAGAGVLVAALYTMKLVKDKRLFRRDEREIDANRSRIRRFSIPLGYALGALLLVLIGVGTPGVRSIVLAFPCGLMLGLWPSLLANYLRLRREAASVS